VISEAREIGADSLLAFCQESVSRYLGNWPPGEEVLAREFVSRFSLHRYPRLEDLMSFCSNLGIEASISTLPQELRGLNGCYGDRKTIVICEEERFPGTKEHTLFHELREILEYAFRDLGFPTETDGQMEVRAERFAAQVRLTIGEVAWMAMFEGARTAEPKWLRWGAFLFIFLFAFGNAASCNLLPYFEDMASRSNH
jgi:hypothetical protein